jgi:deoxyribodipyrimidine photolyase-related protein
MTKRRARTGGGTLRVVLGDQCSRGLSSLRDLDPGADTVLMAEVMGECTYVKHHKRKIALVLSAMRHFARALEARDVRVRYVRLDDADNTQSLGGEVARAAKALKPDAIVVTEAGEWRVEQDMLGWQDATGVAVEIREDDRFLARRQEFRAWAGKRAGLRMEFFYRDMRRRSGILMEKGGKEEGGKEKAAPVGGKWNYDAENRKRLPKGVAVPEVPSFKPDAVTREVIEMVEARFADHFGSLDGFDFAVTARDAGRMLDDFIRNRLPGFGDWQDAMAADEPRLFHSLISTALNCGLLDPLEACRKAEAAYEAGEAPLNAVEGFIRQILGWREFIRGVYWLHMPDYATRNGLGAKRALPDFYWSAETKMRCVAQAVGQTRDLAYAHHIQRLMVTGNFALLAGLHPDEVDEWYLAVYADAYEWVEMPNTRGMALHADHGVVGSKPYAASGAYINRMSDYCGKCHYDVRASTGERACPFNALYWDFIARHAERFAGNTRMAMPLRTLERMDKKKVTAIRKQAAGFLAAMEAGETV